MTRWRNTWFFALSDYPKSYAVASGSNPLVADFVAVVVVDVVVVCSLVL